MIFLENYTSENYAKENIVEPNQISIEIWLLKQKLQNRMIDFKKKLRFSISFLGSMVLLCGIARWLWKDISIYLFILPVSVVIVSMLVQLLKIRKLRREIFHYEKLADSLTEEHLNKS